MSIPFVHCCIILDWGLRVNYLMICDAVHLFIVNKIPLFENDVQTWLQRWSYNSNLSSGSGQVIWRKSLRKCNKMFKKQNIFNYSPLRYARTIRWPWSSFKLLTLQMWQVPFCHPTCSSSFILSFLKFMM